MQSLCPAPPREDPERKSCPAHRTPSSAAAGSVLTGRSTDSPSLLDETRPAPAQLPGHRQRESAPRERPGARPWAGRGPASTPKPGAAVLLHLQTGPEHSRAARGREGRPALARLALKDEDEHSLSPPGEGPAGWWPLPAPKCSPGPSRADPGPDSSENSEESSTSGKSRPPVARHGSPRQQDRCLPGSGRPRQTPRETDRAESVTLQRPLPCWPGQRGQSASRRRLQRAPHSAQGTRQAYSMHGSPTPTHRRQRALQSMWVGDAGVTVWNPGHRATHTWLRGELS